MLPFFGPIYTVLLILLCFILFKIYGRVQKTYEQIEEKLVSQRRRRDYKTSELEDEVSLLDEEETLRNRYYIDIRFEELGLCSKKGDKRYLQGVTGEVNHGEMLMVMGPSGCGKSTFLHTLAGRAEYGKTEGRVYINGKEGSIQGYKEFIGFVPQEDIMIRTLTVKEILEFAAKTRLTWPNDKKEILVEDILEMLGLSDVRFSPIGDESTRGISGGQRKRVNVGIELAGDPCVLLLDEPTSGLDASASKAICESLRKLADIGLTIIAVIHQPRYEIFTLFDKVLLLGKGSTVYFGPTSNVEQYFENLGFQCPPKVNPPDFFLDVISGDIKPLGETPVDLISTWEAYQSTAFPKVELEDYSYDSLSIVEGSVRNKKRSSREQYHGTYLEFAVSFVSTLFLNILGGFIIFTLNNVNNQMRFGAIGGIIFSHLVLSIALISSTIDPWFYSYGAINMGFLVVSLLVLAKYYRNFDMKFWVNFITGFWFTPFGLILGLFNIHVLPKHMAGIKFGSTVSLLFNALFWFPYYVVEIDKDIESIVLFVGCMYISLCGIIVLGHHYPRLPNTKHATKGVGFSYQVWLFFKRGCSQQISEWKGVVFDLGLVTLSGLFLGIIYYSTPYEGSFLEPFSVPDACPKELQNLYPTLCLFLSLPISNPIPGQASLTTLAVSLCAVASSLRVFGSEKTQFVRESSAGISTEAYYLGKSLSHMPIILGAPFMFLLSFYSLATVEASFFMHYILLFLVYFASSGLAYAVSIIVKPSIAQLVGVLIILINMTFSGANPTITQLSQNKLIPNVLIYPTYLSFIRWAQELYYLYEIQEYHTGYFVMQELFGYTFSQWTLCWVWFCVISLLWRSLAYVALVKQEE